MSKSRDLAKVINSDGGLTLRGNTLFETDNAFDIGSAEFKVRDLFVSSNSLWVGDEHKLSIDATTGKFKARKRKKGKIPKKLRDRLVGSGKRFANDTELKNQFIADFFTSKSGSSRKSKYNTGSADFNPDTKAWIKFIKNLGIKRDDGKDYDSPEDIMDDDDDFDEDKDDDKVDATQTATSSTLGLVKIGYTESGKYYPVELSSGKMYVNVPWTDTNTDTNTQVTVNNTLTSTSTSEALSANQGKTLKGLVDGKAASSHSHSQYAASSHTHSHIRHITIIAVEKDTDLANGLDIIGAFELPFSGTVNSFRAKTSTGTCTASAKVNVSGNSKSFNSNATTAGVTSDVTSFSTSLRTFNTNDDWTIDIANASGKGLVITLTIEEA